MFEHGYPSEWSTLKKLIWIVKSKGGGGSSGIWKTVSGTLIHITDALASPVKELSVAINSSTGLTGCEVNVTGKNLLNIDDLISAPSGTYIGFNFKHILVLTLKPSTSYTLSTSFDKTGNVIYINGVNSSFSPHKDSPKTITTDSTGTVTVVLYDRTGINEFENKTVTVQLEEGTQETTYEPFGTTYPISWQTEVGSITSGTLEIAEDGSVTLDSGGITYPLQSITPITTLAGENNIWADAGDMEVTYKASGNSDDLNANEAMNLLMGGAYNRSPLGEGATDQEALNIIMGDDTER